MPFISVLCAFVLVTMGAYAVSQGLWGVVYFNAGLFLVCMLNELCATIKEAARG